MFFKNLPKGFVSNSVFAKGGQVDGEGDKMPPDAGFIAACEKAGVQPTKRQASKYRLGKGAAYKAAKGIK